MPAGFNPFAIPNSPTIAINPIAKSEPGSGLASLMAVQKAVAQQQLMAARAATAASRAGGAGAKYTNYVKLPLGNGDFETVPVVGADKENRAAQEKELMSRRLAQLAAEDKDLQESLTKMAGLSVKGQQFELDKVRQQHLPRLAKKWGISPELAADFMKQSTAGIQQNIAAQQKAINQTGVLQSFIDSTKMGATALWDAIRSLGSTPDEKFAMGEAQSRQRQEILAQNAHLREEALRAQEGIDSWSDFFDNKALNVAEALGDTLSGAGGIIGTQAGTQALVSGIGKGLTAIPHPAAKAAGIALQTPAARTGVALLTGGGTGAGLGGMNLANRLVAEVEAGRMTRAEAIDALEKGQLPAQLLGGGVGAAFSAMPAVNLLPKGIPGLTRSAATKRGQDYIRQQAVKASLKEGADSTLARTAGERVVARAVAEYNTPGIMAAAERYFKAIPRTAVDLAAFNAADTLAGNVAYSQATGQPMSMDGVGQAAVAGIAGAPFFAMLGNRAHYTPRRIPLEPPQLGLPPGGAPSAREPIILSPITPDVQPGGVREIAGALPWGGYTMSPRRNARSDIISGAPARDWTGTIEVPVTPAPTQKFSDIVETRAAMDTMRDRQTPGTVWPVNASAQPPIRRAQQPSAQPATSASSSASNPTTSAIRPEVIAVINAARGNAKQWGPTEISKLYRELAIGKLDPDEARTYMNALVDKKNQPKQKALAAALAQYDAINAALWKAAKNQVEAPVLKELIKNTDSLPEALEAAVTLLDRQDITVKEFEGLRKTAKTQDIRRALLQTQRLFENGEISHEQVKAARGDGHEPTPTQDTASIGSGATPPVAGDGQLGERGANPADTVGNSGTTSDSQAPAADIANEISERIIGGNPADESGGNAGLPAQDTTATEAPAGASGSEAREAGGADGKRGGSTAATEPPATDTRERSAEFKAGPGERRDGASEQARANEPDAVKATEREKNTQLAEGPIARVEAEAAEEAAEEAALQQILSVANRNTQTKTSATPTIEETAVTTPKTTPREAADTFIFNVANAELTAEVEGEAKLSGKSLAEIKGYINDALDAGVKPEELKKRVLFKSPHADYNQEILDTIVKTAKTHKPKDVPVAAGNVVGSGSAFKSWIENPLNMKINDKGPNFIEGPRAVFRNMNYAEAVDAASRLEWKVATEGYDALKSKREREKYNNLKVLGMPSFDKVAVNAAIGEAEAKAQSEGRKLTPTEINDDAYALFMTSREAARNKMNADNGHNANTCGV